MEVLLMIRMPAMYTISGIHFVIKTHIKWLLLVVKSSGLLLFRHINMYEVPLAKCLQIVLQV